MPQVEIPIDLVEQIEATLPSNASVDGFVQDAICEKLAARERRDKFFQLSDQVRQTMSEQGISEQEILDDFEVHRRQIPVVAKKLSYPELNLYEEFQLLPINLRNMLRSRIKQLSGGTVTYDCKTGKRAKFFPTMNRHAFFPAFLASFVLFADMVSGEDHLPNNASAQVVSVAHLFDGGSLLFEINVRGEPHYLLIVSPDSPLSRRLKSGSMPMFWSNDKRFRDQERAVFTANDLKRLVTALARSKEGKIMNQSIASVLLGLHAGMEIRVWGSEAVEALSNENWLSLFSEDRATVEHDNPFD